MKKLNFVFITILTIFLVTSCETLPIFTKDVDPITLFDSDASMYAHLAVKDNEAILETIVLSMTEEIDEGSLERILRQSTSVYFAVYEGTLGKPAYIQMALVGTFPSFLVNASLSENAGWKSYDADYNGRNYSYKEHITGFQLATVSSKIVVLSTKNVVPMQDRFNENDTTASVNWPTGYDTLGTESPILSLFNSTKTLSIYFPNARSLFSNFLQIPLELPIEYAFATIKSIEDDVFYLDAQIKINNPEIVIGPLSLLTLTMFRSSVEVEIIGTDTININGIPLNSSLLNSLLK